MSDYHRPATERGAFTDERGAPARIKAGARDRLGMFRGKGEPRREAQGDARRSIVRPVSGPMFSGRVETMNIPRLKPKAPKSAKPSKAAKPRSAPPRVDAARHARGRSAAGSLGQARNEQLRHDQLRDDQLRDDQLREDQLTYDQLRYEQLRAEQARAGQLRQERLRQEELRQEESRQEESRQQELRQEDSRQELRQGETRQREVRQGETRQGETRQGETRQVETRQGETRQGEMRDQQHRTERHRSEQFAHEQPDYEQRGNGQSRGSPPRRDGRSEPPRPPSVRREPERPRDANRDANRKRTREADRADGSRQPRMQGFLAAHGVERSFGGRMVVKGVSLYVRRGEAVGLLGPNGAGKTTVFYMITGLITADRGRIELDAHDVTALPMYQRARLGIGYLPQEASIFRGLNVEENIRAVLEVVEPSRKRREHDLDALLEEFNIARLRKTPSIALSGGERRRVEIARALATRPNYMLLDEPFAGIDPIAVGDIQALVRHLTRRGIGVLITDHNVRETLGLTDRAYIIYSGEVLMEGQAEDIVNNPDVRRLYLGEEFRM